MARTFNRRPVTIDGPNNSDIKNYTFNYEQWKGIDDGKNFLSVDQSTFSDAQNMYIDSEGLLSSRPAVEPVPESITLPRTYQIENIYPVNDNITVYVCYKDSFHHVIIRDTSSTSSGVLTEVVKSSTARYSVKYINSNEKLYLFVTNANDTTTPTKLYIYNKTTQAMLTEAEVLKSIYVPTTKIFTGNNEEEGEAVNLWTTSERYLYYYNDVTGISGDAIGKTLTWEGKTLIWSDDYKPHLVKEHYSLPDDAIVTVASTGAVAWVVDSVLHYAVNGSEIYSWSLTNILSTKYIVSRLRFNNAGNTIFIEIIDTSDITKIYPKLYMVSCVATNESNTLLHPNPVSVVETLLSYSTLKEYVVVAYDYIDDGQWCIYTREYSTISETASYYLYWNVNGTGVIIGDDLKIDNDIVRIDALAMTKTYIVALALHNTSNYTEYIAGIYKPSDGKTVHRVDTFKLGQRIDGVGSMHYQICLAIDAANYYAYVPTEVNRTGTPWTVKFGGIRHSLSDSTKTYIAADTNSVYELTNTAGVNPHLSPIPYIFFDNYNKVAIDNKILDFTKVDFSKANSPESGAAISITTLDNSLLPSTTLLYNQIEKIGSVIKILTRFSTDTFELYYDKLGEVTYPKSITDILYLNNYFFAVDNVSYYTENKYNDDGEFLFYIPDKNRNEFDSSIVKFHQIGDDIIGIFFENEIHYAKYDSNISTYRYYKTKLQFGIPKGSDVITSDDSITTYIPTRSGIVALSYQNFISATEQGTVRISDQIFDTANELLFFKDGYIRIVKYRYWIIFYKNLVSRLWVYDTRNQSWWRQILPFGFTQFFIRKGNLIGLRGGVEYRRTEELSGTKNKYMDNLLVDSETTYFRIGWYFKSQKLHLGAPNYFKSIQGMTFFDSAEDNYENIFDLETYSYRDKPYVNGEQNVHYNVRMIRTYLLRMHTMKTNEFQFKISSDNTIAQDDSIRPIKLSSISIRYRITGEVR